MTKMLKKIAENVAILSILTLLCVVTMGGNAYAKVCFLPDDSDCADGTTSNFWPGSSDGCDADCNVICTAVTIPANAHGTTTCQPKKADCTNNGSAVYTAWECNSGYRKNSAAAVMEYV